VSTHSVPTAVPAQAPIRRPRRSRQEVVGTIVDFEQARAAHTSQRQFATQQGVPRTTLQAWLERKERLDSGAQVVAFFESPQGLAFLHRLVLAAHLVFGQMGACGIRLMCEFLDKAQLGPFVAHSLGSQHKVARAVEEQILVYAAEQRARLGAQMEPKTISVCEDETFHPQVCLVAVEPVSNFLLVERYADRRDAATWTAALKQGLQGLAVQVAQVTSDEAKGLLRHTRQELNVHHGPDLFHVQYEVSRGTAGALGAKVTQAQGVYDQASEALQQVLADQQQRQQEPPGPGRPVDFPRRIAQAKQTLTQAQADLNRAQANQDKMQQLVRRVGTIYHPFDLCTGVAQSEAEVHTALEHTFHQIRALATAAGLAEAAFSRIQKAYRVVLAMIATIGFFHRTVQQRVAAAALEPSVARLVLKFLIPGLYLHAVAGKLPTAAERTALRQRAQSLLGTLQSSAVWVALSSTVQQDLHRLARDCAQLFQRSSSCVEGRNGYLALRHHQLRRLSDAKLGVLTALHNYVCKRPDGTTAAERFFGAKPDDLLDTLCDRVALPARPRATRSAPRPAPLALAA
jgi:hypothetical protein